jgi:glycosyltransferase involved in cell wall biosynthesis
MKIMMIVPYAIFPPDEGGRIRAYNLLKQLSSQHEVLLLTPQSDANRTNDLPARLFETTPAGRRNQFVSPRFLRRAPEIVRRERPDVVLIEYPWPGLHAMYLQRRCGVPFVLDAPNVEGERFRSTGARYWRAVDAYERLVARRARRVFAVSEDDRARFIDRGIAPSKVQVVPNGVDPDRLHPDEQLRAATRRELGAGDATRLMLFFGQLDYWPNREALHVIADEVLPRIDASGGDVRIVITGKRPPKLPRLFEHPRVTYAGIVPSMLPYLNAADAVMAPLLSGGGTRLKLLESIACGTPVVSTTAGAEGIERAAFGELLVVEDGWDGFVKRLLDREHVKRGNVPAPFLDMYSWANIVRRIDW